MRRRESLCGPAQERPVKHRGVREESRERVVEETGKQGSEAGNIGRMEGMWFYNKKQG